MLPHLLDFFLLFCDFVIYDIMKIWRKGLTEWINQLINDEAVYKTAPATPGLLMSEWEKSQNLTPHKNQATPPHTKSRNLSTKKITHPVH